MKHIKQYQQYTQLNELINDNLLYHATKLENLISIMKSDILYKSIYHFNISFSRNKLYWHGYYAFRNTRIILDRDLLSRHYKITPFDYWYNTHTKSDNKRHFPFEYEEFINKNINNIGEYIREIQIINDNIIFEEDNVLSKKENIDIIINFLEKYPSIKINLVEVEPIGDKYKTNMCRVKSKKDIIELLQTNSINI